MSVTVIEQLSWVVAWDDASGGHVYLNDSDVAFSTEAGFTYIGPRFSGEAQARMPGRGRLLFPGFVDVHSHIVDRRVLGMVLDPLFEPPDIVGADLAAVAERILAVDMPNPDN